MNVMPREFGVRKPWHYIVSEPAKWLARACRSSCTRSTPPVASTVNSRAGADYAPLGDDAATVELLHSALPTPAVRAAMSGLRYAGLIGSATAEADVAAERVRVEHGQYAPDCPVVIDGIRKTYPARDGREPFVAVQDVSFLVERHECFGLLGANGAGKTTLISILTGLIEPTSGRARIAGYDIRTEMASIQRCIGVCPQFDILVDELTCRETLLFYARIKGLPAAEERMRAEAALRQVNLHDATDRLVKNLSGGMKRRLSLAVSLVGSPDIVFLDEPTTGLDPKARQQVWEVLQEVKRAHSVILTTHGMDEADYLCTRIGIMSRGRLMCIGSPMHLKRKYGNGYEITVHCKSAADAAVVCAWLPSIVPGIAHTETFASTCRFNLHSADLSVSRLFASVERERERLGIEDWGITMTTLEDVFIAIVRDDEAMDAAEPRNGAAASRA